MTLAGAVMLSVTAAAGAGAPNDKRAPATAVRFCPRERAVGDVMPFYHDGEYHVFYLLNASGNAGIDWEHTVSRDLVHWRHLPAAIRHDPADPRGPEGGCMFTGSIIEDHGTFHAFYTSWNPDNPAGREFVSHATSGDLVSWTKHPADRIAPDGIHYANHRERDFRDPCVVWDARRQQHVMWITANQPGKPGYVFGRLTSPDLHQWLQLPALEGIPGDECPDFFQVGGTCYLHGCNVYAWAESQDGPWRFPSYNRLDRRMAAKRVFDGKRHVWFGGWLNGPMSIPREVYAGTDGLLFMKPVPEVVAVFRTTALLESNLAVTADTPWQHGVPQDYLLEATVDLSRGRELAVTVRGAGKEACRLVLSAGKQALVTAAGDACESRPLPLDFSRPVTLQAFILDGIAEVFVNSRFARTFFISPAGGSLRLEAQGDVLVRSLHVRTTVNGE